MPTITWKPWKPVAKIERRRIDAILKAECCVADTHSLTCREQTPKITVSKMPVAARLLSPKRIAWCAYVTVTPDVSKISVFRNGRSHVGSATIPSGGHVGEATKLIAGIACVEVRPEKSKEEHDLGNDEQQHAHTQTVPDFIGVIMTISRFDDDVAPPQDRTRDQRNLKIRPSAHRCCRAYT